MRAALLALVMLTGCATVSAERVVTVQKLVPVPVVCAETVTRPSWAVKALGVAAELEDRVEALLSDDYRHRAYEAELESAGVKCGLKVN